MRRFLIASLALLVAAPLAWAAPADSPAGCETRASLAIPAEAPGEPSSGNAFLDSLNRPQTAQPMADTSCCTQAEITACYEGIPSPSCWVDYLGCENFGYCYCHYFCL